ncbi:MAG: peptidylprolyl isomerase [Planctomycetota bacterium]
MTRRIWIISLAMATLVPAACVAAPAASTSEASDAAATVNGATIPMKDVHEWLIRAHGATAVEQLVSTEVVKQAAEAEGITIDQDDLDAEAALTIARMSPGVDPSQYERILSEVLKDKQYPRIQWDTMIRRNAMLRKLAEQRLTITDEMLTAAFNNRYGLKVRVRLIQCASVTDARKILALLAAGESFESLAREYSMLTELAADGGLMPAFSRDDESIPVALRRAAFDLTDGQVSEIIQVGRYFHLLQRVETIPPETDVKFEDVKDELRREVATAAVWRMQERILNDLMSSADIVLVDPMLRRHVRQAQDASP